MFVYVVAKRGGHKKSTGSNFSNFWKNIVESAELLEYSTFYFPSDGVSHKRDYKYLDLKLNSFYGKKTVLGAF